jgi:hypothetical protein
MKLHAQGNYGNFITKIHYVGVFIVSINHNGEVDVISAQALHWIIFHNSLVNMSNLKTKARKGIISCYNASGIISLKKN